MRFTTVSPAVIIATFVDRLGPGVLATGLGRAGDWPFLLLMGSRGRWFRLVVVLATFGLPVVAVAEGAGWQAVLERLEQEKMLAEGCAGLLKAFADDRPMARVQGQRLYERARADVDGSLSLFPADLAGDRSAITELRERLDAVQEQRQALCREVNATVGPTVRAQGAAQLVDLLARGIQDAGSAPAEGADQIARDHRSAVAMPHEALASAIEAARWMPYAAVPEASP